MVSVIIVEVLVMPVSGVSLLVDHSVVLEASVVVIFVVAVDVDVDVGVVRGLARDVVGVDVIVGSISPAFRALDYKPIIGDISMKNILSMLYFFSSTYETTEKILMQQNARRIAVKTVDQCIFERLYACTTNLKMY